MQICSMTLNSEGLTAGGTGAMSTNTITGEALSLTGLAHFSFVSDCQYLACGIDSLDLGLMVTWGVEWDRLTETLDREKERAAGTSGILFDEGPCLIWPSGKPPNFRWHLQFPEFHLFL